MCFLGCCVTVADSICIVVLSQANVYHAQRAELFRQHVIRQSEMLHVVSHLTAFIMSTAYVECSGTSRSLLFCY